MAFNDPKGYYAVLGVSANAEVEEIKIAFRARAKRLHPDTNTRPGAAEQFRLLNEAYRVLRDPERRRRYHARGEKPEPPPQQPPPPPRPEAKRPEPPPRPSPPPKSGFSACRACGTLSAQPRIAIFHVVEGRPFKPERRTVSGVYCPRCAADAAVDASLRTWVRGMTALPKGPVWAFAALWRNLKGGDRPVEANARMLLAQARAFLGKGEVDLARATIVQALPFAAETEFRHEAETLLASLGGAAAARALKSRWPRFGRALWLQLLPFVLVIAIFAGAMALSLGRGTSEALPAAKVPAGPPPPPAKALVALPEGPSSPLPVMATVRDRVALRGSPSAHGAMLARLAKGTRVTMTALVPGEDWVQVRLADGRLGFVSLADLK